MYKWWIILKHLACSHRNIEKFLFPSDFIVLFNLYLQLKCQIKSLHRGTNLPANSLKSNFKAANEQFLKVRIRSGSLTYIALASLNHQVSSNRKLNLALSLKSVSFLCDVWYLTIFWNQWIPKKIVERFDAKSFHWINWIFTLIKISNR